MFHAHQVIAPAAPKLHGVLQPHTVAVPAARVKHLANMLLVSRRSECALTNMTTVQTAVNSIPDGGPAIGPCKAWHEQSSWGGRRHQEWARLFSVPSLQYGHVQRTVASIPAVWLSHAPPVLAAAHSKTGARSLPFDIMGARLRVVSESETIAWVMSGPAALSDQNIDTRYGITPSQAGCLSQEITAYQHGLGFTHYAHTDATSLSTKYARYGNSIDK